MTAVGEATPDGGGDVLRRVVNSKATWQYDISELSN